VAGPQYTGCVSPEDYEPLPWNDTQVAAAMAVLAGAILASPFAGPVILLLGTPAMMMLRDILEYMLNGKLVCHTGDKCAIGWVAEVEPVGFGKSFPEDIDNDYCINLLLAPHSLSDFQHNGGESQKNNAAIGTSEKVQGHLIAEQMGMPWPREPKGGEWGRYYGYFTDFKGTSFKERFVMGDETVHIPLMSETLPFKAPVLHCECEGSRIRDVLDVLDNFPPGLGKVCKTLKKYLGGFGKWVCAAVSALLAPLLLAALAAAWARAKPGDPAAAGGGTLDIGDLVIVRGRWVFDAGHGGSNEVHAVKTIVKLPEDASWSDFQDFHDTVCKRVSEAPPPPAEPGHAPQGMTPEQESVWNEQQQPENWWLLHPEVDGCEPQEEEPPPPH
jgi:hypothetical protein